MADGEALKKKSDLGVRTASAIVMLAIAIAAMWLDGLWLDGFCIVVAGIGLAEALRLIYRATVNVAARFFGTLFAVIYIGLAGFALVEMPLIAFVPVLVLVIVVDVCAYFSGRSFGGPKIAPSISPSKTWAGLIGAMLGAGGLSMAVIAFIGAAASAMSTSSNDGLPATTLALVFAGGAGVAIAAQAGDFLESWLKRKAGMKDSSNLIPGHGGVLDRIDGLIPVAIIGWIAHSQVAL